MTVSILLSQDGQVLAMLCSRVGLSVENDVKPLSTGEWNDLAPKIANSEWKRPAELLGRDASQIASSLAVDERLAERIRQLLDRAGQFAIELDMIQGRGMWMVSRADELYPAGLERRLQTRAPVVLFGAGNPRLLNAEGVAVVGSRDADEEALKYAAALGENCAAERLMVISGAARGIDRQAMLACLEAGGKAIGVVADNLERFVRDPEVRRFILEDRLVLTTPSHYSAHFTVGNAMGRNKIVYGLSKLAVVVAVSEGSGGTWNGALEDLKHKWTPLLVRVAAPFVAAAERLVKEGAIALAGDEPAPGISELESKAEMWRSAAPEFYWTAPAPAPASSSSSSSAPESIQPGAESGNGDLATTHSSSLQSLDMFDVAWPAIREYLAQPKTEKQIAVVFHLEAAQVRKWMSRAVEEKLARRIQRPVRYQLNTSTVGGTGQLFPKE